MTIAFQLAVFALIATSSLLDAVGVKDRQQGRSSAL